MDTKNIEDIYKLTPTQQAMLIHAVQASETGVNFEQVSVTLKNLNAANWILAWRKIVVCHPMLRTAFVWEGIDEPRQIVSRRVELPVEQHDWRDVRPEEQRQRLAALLQADRRRGLNLAPAPLMRLTLIRLDEMTYEMIWSYHHILMDGWSVSVIMEQVQAYYAALQDGRMLELPPPRPFRDYVTWLHQQNWQEAETFWRKRLQGVREATPLPLDQALKRLSDPQSVFNKQEINLSPETNEAIHNFARQYRVTINTLIQASWAILLKRYSGEPEVLWGLVLHGRPPDLSGVESMVGLFINGLPIRIRVPSTGSILEWLNALQAELVEFRRYGYTSLAQIQGWLGIRRNKPMFDYLLIDQSYRPLAAAKGQTFEGYRLSEVTGYPLTLYLTENQVLTLQMVYDCRRFDEWTIAQLLQHLHTLLTGMIANPQQSLQTWSMLTAEEIERLLDWSRWANKTWRPSPALENDTQCRETEGQSLHELFEQQVQRTPDAVAVIAEDNYLTYHEFNRRANQLARYLQQQGVSLGMLVGVCVERSLEMVIGLLGVLKAGGAYVPLDPSYPPDRLAFILEDAQVSVVVTQAQWAADLFKHVTRPVCLDTEWEGVARQNDINLKHTAKTANLAYVIYTSGSTGRPKGVQIPHRAVVNFLNSMWQQLAINERDILLSVTTLSFDIAGLELYLPLITGACVALASRAVAADGRAVGALLTRLSTTVMQATPVTWRLLLESGWSGQPQLKVLCGGEAFPRQLADQLIDKSAAVWNMYGPTETTIWSMMGSLSAGEEFVSLGRPIADTQIYLLDEHHNLVPVGVPGELYIGGAGLAWGYLHRPDLTAEKFMPDPFSAEPGARLYRTGDLARYWPDGNLEFLGRIDFQVKVRGFRIESGEIETVLRDHPQVGQAVVVAREDQPGHKHLVAYLVAKNGALPATDELRSWLKVKLPDYMCPAVFVKLEALPLTPNGKIDRKALPAPEGGSSELKANFVAPRTSTEKALAEIWTQMLGVKQVGRHDNFFELGGDSLLGLRVATRAGGMGLHFTPQQLFEHQTIAELATVVGAAGGEDEQSPIMGETPLTGPQTWFFENADDHGGWWMYLLAYHAPSAVGRSPELLAQVIEHLLVHHDELRGRFTQQESGWQKILVEPSDQNPFICVDLTELDTAKHEQAILAASDAMQLDMKLSTLLLRGMVFYRGEDQPARLLIFGHHLVIDGFSRDILTQDFQTAYLQLLRGEPIRLPPKTASVKEFVERLQAYARSEEMHQELENYWFTLPWEQLRPLPVDDAQGEASRNVGSMRAVEMALNAEETHALQTVIPQLYKAQVSEVLLTALLEAIAQWSGRSHQLIGWTYTGRGSIIPGPVADLDLSRTVGWLGFDSYLLLERVATNSLAELLQSIQEQCRRIPNKGMGWYLTRYYGEAEMVARVRPLVREEDMVVTINYLGTMAEPQEDQFEIMRRATEPRCIPWNPQSRDPHPRLYITAQIMGGCFSTHWDYNQSVYNHTTIERIASNFTAALRDLINRQ